MHARRSFVIFCHRVQTDTRTQLCANICLANCESFFAPPPLIQFDSPFFFVAPLTTGYKKSLALGTLFQAMDDVPFARPSEQKKLHHTRSKKNDKNTRTFVPFFSPPLGPERLFVFFLP